MAKDEMQTITDDKWGEEIWGIVGNAAHSTSSRPSIQNQQVNSVPSPKLVFYFGKEVCLSVYFTRKMKTRSLLNENVPGDLIGSLGGISRS